MEVQNQSRRISILYTLTPCEGIQKKLVVLLSNLHDAASHYYLLDLCHGEKEAVFGSYPVPYLGMRAKSFQKLWSPLGRSLRNLGSLSVS